MASNGSADVASDAAAAPAVVAPASLPHLAVVDRLSKIELVSQAWDYANQRYAQLKSSNKYLTGTLDRAEGLMQQVVHQVTPVINKLEQPIYLADTLAIQGLDYVEKKVDSLQRSSTELKDTTQKVVDKAQLAMKAVRAQAAEVVFFVIGLPKNTVLQLDVVLSKGENLLDYLLPEVGSNEDESKPAVTIENDDLPVGPDAASLLTILLEMAYRTKYFTNKVQNRVLHYSRNRWLPVLLTPVVVLKTNLGRLISAVAPSAASNGKSATNGSSTSTDDSSQAGNTNQEQQ